MLDFQKLSADYQQALLRQVVPFWLKYGRDEQHGGYFDLLSAAGQVVEGDKYVSRQAQQVWSFAWLYNTLDGQASWLTHALHGASFLSQHAHDKTFSCVAQLDRRGNPTVAALDTLPGSAVVMAYAQVHQATGDDEWATRAKQTFSAVYQQWTAIRSTQSQTIGRLRQLRHISEPLALLKATIEMQSTLDEEVWKNAVDAILHEILGEFLDRRADTVREYILPDGAFINTPEGRRLNIGLIFRAASYLLDLCAGSSPLGIGNRKLAMQVVAWCLRICEQAWDPAGGLNQYVDQKSQPVLFADWQQKWAWVHLEAVTALMKGYFYTRHPDCPKWFKRIHDYTFQHFPDQKQVGWQVALDGQMQPILQAKATPAVGCFSLIRCMAETAQFLGKCGQLQPLGRHVRVI